jgi:hypothetical protein
MMLKNFAYPALTKFQMRREMFVLLLPPSFRFLLAACGFRSTAAAVRASRSAFPFIYQSAPVFHIFN